MDYGRIQSVVLICLGICLTLVTAKPQLAENPSNIHPLADFVADQEFNGAAIGVLRDDRLIYAEGQGQIRGRYAHARTLFPALGFSKLLTAVAVFQLMEQGKLSLSDRVFGNHGILYYFRPEGARKHHGDPRLKDITVRDLLYHTAGWDESVGPVYDPMLNALYIRKDYNVVDIAAEKEVFGIMNHDDIIRYMVEQPLQYNPGTRRSESNFGYCLLGRIVEELSDLPYEEYVTQMILKPSGMWHTRMGPSHADTRQGRYDPSKDPDDVGVDPGYVPLQGDGGMRSIFDAVPAQILDSCLGWHSNVFDLSRFFTALFKSGSRGLLSQESVESLILEPAFRETPDEDADAGAGAEPDAWDGIGFTVTADGGLWYTTDHVEVGAYLAIYHQGPPLWLAAPKAQDDGDLTLFFMGASDQPHPDLHEKLAQWLRGANIARDFVHEDGLAADLADAHVVLGDRDVYVRYQLSEHHLQSYTSALRRAGYVPTWIHGYPFDDNTNFVVISERAQQPAKLNFVVLVGHAKDRFIHSVVQQIRQDLQLTLLQTYQSVAHDDRPCHVALLETQAKPVAAEFDIDTDLPTYALSAQEAMRDGFIPVVQSVDVDEDRYEDLTVTYLMRENPDGVGSIMQHDLSLDDLRKAAENAVTQGYTLAYLDTFFANDQPRFSVIFHEGLDSHWILQTDVTVASLPAEVSKWQALGYILKLLAAYDSAEDVYFAAVWVAVPTAAPQ